VSPFVLTITYNNTDRACVNLKVLFGQTKTS